MSISRAEAVRRLTARHAEQARLWPLFAEKIDLRGYIAANVRDVMRGGLLSEYAESAPKHTNHAPMSLVEAKREALRLANETGKIWAVVVAHGAECGVLGNNQECEVVPFPSGPDRVNMANIGPGARLSA